MSTLRYALWRVHRRVMVALSIPFVEFPTADEARHVWREADDSNTRAYRRFAARIDQERDHDKQEAA